MTEGIRITTGEEYIEDAVSRNVLEKQFVTNMSGETPSVRNRRFFVGVNTSPVDVTDFLYGAPGQRIYVLGDGNMTIKHGTRSEERRVGKECRCRWAEEGCV